MPCPVTHSLRFTSPPLPKAGFTHAAGRTPQLFRLYAACVLRRQLEPGRGVAWGIHDGPQRRLNTTHDARRASMHPRQASGSNYSASDRHSPGLEAHTQLLRASETEVAALATITRILRIRGSSVDGSPAPMCAVAPEQWESGEPKCPPGPCATQSASQKAAPKKRQRAPRRPPTSSRWQRPRHGRSTLQARGTAQPRNTHTAPMLYLCGDGIPPTGPTTEVPCPI